MILQFRAFARPLVALSAFCLSMSWATAAFAQQLSIADASIVEGNSGTTSLVFTVKLSAASANVVRFDFATSDATATAGTDYTATSGRGLRIVAGNTSKTISVPITGDLAAEPNETFKVVLSNPVGATFSDNEAIGTITNDDTPSGPSLSINDVSAWEGNSYNYSVEFTITLSEPSTSSVSVTAATAAGTASGAAGDYYPNSMTSFIPPGQTEARFYMQLIGDTTVEPDETFFVNLSNAVGATIADGQGMGTILDDDTNPIPPGAPTNVVATAELMSASVSFDAPANAGTGRIEGYTVTSSPAGAVDDWPGSPSTTHHISGLVKGTYYTFTVTATNGGAMGPASQPSNSVRPLVLPGPVTLSQLQPGNSMVTVSFNPPADQGDFPITGYRVTPNPEDGYDWDWGSTDTSHEVRNLNRGTYYTFTIVAMTSQGEGEPLVTTESATPAALPGAPVMGSATGSGSTATVTFSAPATDGGSPITGYVVRGEGSCYGTVDSDSGSLSLSHSMKNLPANTACTFIAHAINAGGEGPGSEPSNEVVYDFPDLIISFPQVQEGDSGTSIATFTFSLSRATDHPVSFDVATSNGTATAGSDYVARGSVHLVIPAGETSASFDVTVNGDTEGEADETFQSNISNLDGAFRIPPMFGRATIKNDDPLPQLVIDDASIVEGNTGYSTLAFHVGLEYAAPCDVHLSALPQGGTATKWQEYNGNTINATIPKGATSGVVNVEVYSDTVEEQDETFLVTLSDVSCAVVADGTATGTITDDDDVPAPTLSIGDVSIAEGDSGTKTATFTVSLSAAATWTVYFNVVSADGTATAASDYAGFVLAAQQIAAGQTSKTVSVTINGDTTVEPDETFTLSLSNVFGATVADGTAIGTITNDDVASGPALSVGDVSIAEGNAGTSVATFTVTMSAVQATAVKFDIATANVTASAGSDYVAASATAVRIPAGKTSRTFAVTINGDTASEGDEIFFVNLSNPVGVAIADGQAVGTITNDDAAATPTLSIADASVAEGNSGTKVLTFTVSLSPSAAGEVTYDIATSNGTATAGSDYVAASLAGQSIAAGATSKTFAVTINGDATQEANETFNVTLSNVVGATLGDGSAAGTITNDDGSGGGTPSISIADVSMAEGNSLSKQMTFTVKLSAAASTAVTYTIATANGTALAPGDYTAKTSTGQSIAAGATSKTFTVAVKGDRVVEPNETFTVNISAVTGATVGDGQAVGTITNDDAGTLGIARFDAAGLVDDIDDGNAQLVLSGREYAALLLDSAKSLCARSGGAAVVAVEDVENRAVLADLALAAGEACRTGPRYAAVMADGDSRGFLVDAAGPRVLASPRRLLDAAATRLDVQVDGQAKTLSIVLAGPEAGSPRARAARTRALAQSVQQSTLERRPLVLLGAVGVADTIELKPADKVARPIGERMLVNRALMDEFAGARVDLVPQAGEAAAAPVLQLQ
jgi:hypothetical protein